MLPMNIRTHLLLMGTFLTALSGAGAQPLDISGRINKPRGSVEANKENPSGLSKSVWAPEGYASADSVTSSIGYSMLKWSFGISVAALIIALAFTAGTGSQNTNHGHSHSH